MAMFHARRLVTAIGIAVGLTAPIAAAHDPGLSRSTVRFDPSGITVRLAFHQNDLAGASLTDWTGNIRRGFQVSCGTTGPHVEFAAAVDDGQGGVVSSGALDSTACGAVLVRAPLLSTLAPGHRHVMEAADPEGMPIATRILSASNASITLEGAPATVAPLAFTTLIGEGIRHILVGYDHLAFVLTLLLGILLTARDRRWTNRQAVQRLFLVVSAFTLAHSLTLGLAALNLVHVAPAPVEALIALSIVAAGAMNFAPGARRHGVALALAFGLIHGFGFASAFAGLAPPGETMGWTTVAAFNLGVELGQLMALAPALAVGLWLMAAVGSAPRLARQLSLATAGLGFVWFVQRAAGL